MRDQSGQAVRTSLCASFVAEDLIDGGDVAVEDPMLGRGRVVKYAQIDEAAHPSDAVSRSAACYESETITVPSSSVTVCRLPLSAES